MKILNAANCLRLVVLLMALALIGIIWTSNCQNAARYGELVEDEKLSLKSDIKWQENGDSASIVLWLHNNSGEYVRGTFVFEITLDYSAIDLGYLQSEELTSESAKSIRGWMDRFNVKSPKADAILHFIDRGRKFQDTLTAEPCEIPDGDDSLYVFCLRKELELFPSQLMKVECFQELDGYEMGFDYSARIRRIIPRKWPW